MNTRIRLIVVCGPTAVGKTGAAIALAARFGGEIVNADSMQVYRLMDIGTAKPTADEQACVRHHLVDVADPEESFDAARFARMGRAAIAEIAGRGRVPIVAGGTGLYIKALLYGLAKQAPSDAAVRRCLRREAEQMGAAALHRRLAAVDSETAARVHPNDSVRIVRALEVYTLSGRPISAHHRDHGFADAPFDTFKIGLDMDRQSLYARIDQRVDAMMTAGLAAEVRDLLARGYSPELRSMQSLGYRHMVAFLDGRTSIDEAVATLKRDTRHFAKRQFTWFRADAEIRWTRVEDIAALFTDIAAFLNTPLR
ncbi:MAG: tRNA (adenosine(37)-N6)-dimethylallyltransferase MiaA [Pseudomonadota bacterium]